MTPAKPTRIAVKRRQPSGSRRNSAPASVTASGIVWMIAVVLASGRWKSAVMKNHAAPRLAQGAEADEAPVAARDVEAEAAQGAGERHEEDGGHRPADQERLEQRQVLAHGLHAGVVQREARHRGHHEEDAAGVVGEVRHCLTGYQRVPEDARAGDEKGPARVARALRVQVRPRGSVAAFGRVDERGVRSPRPRRSRAEPRAPRRLPPRPRAASITAWSRSAAIGAPASSPRPCPPGSGGPTITFSFRPTSLSRLPCTDSLGEHPGRLLEGGGRDEATGSAARPW